jgi:PPOX class probable F420-dependent enzyme
VRLSAEQSRSRFAAARVARLATVRPDGAPHLVPIVFAVEGDRVTFAVDGKPKSTTDLQRLANIAAEPRVCLLADVYDEDWSQLWWARADGTARMVDGPAPTALIERYPAYADAPPPGPVVVVAVDRWSGWAARG